MRGVRSKRSGVLLIAACLMGFLFSQNPASEPDKPATVEEQLEQGLRTTFGAVAILEVTRTTPEELRVKTGLPVISDEAYRRLLVEVCALVVSTPEATYQSIRFVNGFEKQGFIYKAPSECEVLIGKTEKEAKAMIFAATEFCRGRC